MRVLLPVRPDNDCAEPARILDALFDREDVSILRIFVYRPAELDVYDPELLATFTEVRRLDQEAVRRAASSTKAHCRKLLDNGFHVESAIVSGFPVDKIAAEARLWKADLILLHAVHAREHEARVGRLIGALIDSSPVPVLIYTRIPATIGARIAAAGAGARPWAERLAKKQQGAVHEIGEDDLARELDGSCCDLLVMPAQHHFAPAIFGSTERSVIRESEIPVVLIPR